MVACMPSSVGMGMLASGAGAPPVSADSFAAGEVRALQPASAMAAQATSASARILLRISVTPLIIARLFRNTVFRNGQTLHLTNRLRNPSLPESQVNRLAKI